VTLLDATTVTASFALIPKASINKLQVSGPANAKQGRVATYRAKVTNSGNAAATGVRLKVSGRGVSFQTVVGTTPAGKSRTIKVRLKFKKPGKIKATFKVTSSNAGGKTVKKTINVRK